MKQYQNKKIIISGGGTGGHIFPAISIANAIMELEKNAEILFVGATGKIEMEKVPAAGYKIIGLPVTGFPRKLSFRQFSFFLKLINSLIKSGKIIKSFKPDVVVGVGGYASGPLLRIASRKGIPSLIQEQNSYAGITNRLLAKKANKICVAFDNMEKYFPANKILFTGNPVRQDLNNVITKKEEAFQYFNLDKQISVMLVLGGSLGAKTINQSLIKNISKIARNDVQVIWQTGKYYFQEARSVVDNSEAQNINVYDFITRMDLAYAAADIVISRAGAGTISELCLVKKPAILVPSPNVAEDHQTKNALALVSKKAALVIKDKEAINKLIDLALDLVKNNPEKSSLSENIARLAKKDSAKIIAEEILNL